jgi:glyoxylase-like metal-dependent hydrolase (beta-lactamase superfamily II)
MFIHTMATGPLETNTYLVGDRTAGEAMVVDPGGDADDILAFLQKEHLRLKYIVNTHGHFDHVSGNRILKELTGASILIHEADAPMLGMAARSAEIFLLRAENSPAPDILLEDREEVRIGSVAFRVAHTPGHSPGGITLVGNGVAFCGDLVFYGSVGRTDLPGGSERTLLQSIRKVIMALPDDTILYPGHGPETTVIREKLNNPFFDQ